jgi:hypothetical protein
MQTFHSGVSMSVKTPRYSIPPVAEEAREETVTTRADILKAASRSL